MAYKVHTVRTSHNPEFRHPDPRRQSRDFSDPTEAAKAHERAGYEKCDREPRYIYPPETLDCYRDATWLYREQFGQVWRKRAIK
jgi:hypothetical protein